MLRFRDTEPQVTQVSTGAASPGLCPAPRELGKVLGLDGEGMEEQD